MRVGAAPVSVNKRSRGAMVKPARERLRELRERAGYSLSAMAAKLGYNSAAGVNRYELAKHFPDDKKIPYDYVKRLAPLLVGAGNPPITMQELLDISDYKPTSRRVVEAFHSAFADEAQGLLLVRYRIERGVYIPADGPSRSLGTSRIGSSGHYPVEHQFVAVLADDTGGLRKGTQLHCIDPSVADPNDKQEVVIGVPYKNGDLVELFYGRVTVRKNGGMSVFDIDGMPLDGSILGIVIGKYISDV